MTFAEYLVVLQRRWRVWVAMLVLGLAVAATASALAPVKYTASATSFVSANGSADAGQTAILEGSEFAVQRVKSYSALASSPRVLQPVIEQFNLPETVRQLASRVVATTPEETVLLQVEVSDPNRRAASTIANAVSIQLANAIEELETPPDASRSNVEVTLTDPASAPTAPTSPRTLLNLLVGGLAGLALGLAAAVLRHHFDRRIKSADDVRAVPGIALLGSVPYKASSRRNPLVALDQRAESTERYRTVRTALKLASIDSGLRQFVVTSPLGAEGKTVTACNLAISWAQSGASVCLVEADLRRPKVGEYLGVDAAAGLTDVLLGEASLDSTLVPWNGQMLTVLTAGSVPPDPAALLGSDAMEILRSRLADRFDVVIYDAAPMLPVTDAVVLGRQLDGMVLAIRHGSTTREQVSTCVDLARDARIHLLGGVLTFARGSADKQHAYGMQHAHGPRHLTAREQVALSPKRSS